MTTKSQKRRIARLGAEWAVLDSEEQAISRLAFNSYLNLSSGQKKPRELKVLEHQQRRISERKRQISDEIVAIESGESSVKGPPRGRPVNAFVEVRDAWIRRMRDRSDEEICRTLDLDLAVSDAPPMGFPESWSRKYGMSSYLDAYQHPKCKGLVERLISGARRSF